MYWRASASSRSSSSGGGCGARSNAQRPGAGGRTGAAAPARVPARARAAARLRRRDQRAQAREPVAGDAARAHQLPERVLGLAAQAVRALDDVVEEAGARLAQEARARRAPAPKGRPSASGSVVARRQQPVQIAPPHDRDRRRAAGRHRRLARRQASPRQLARQAEPVEPRAVVTDHARRQHLALPGAGGDLAALQLRDHLRQPAASLQRRPRAHVLPREQEAHVVGRGRRLDLLAQAVEHAAVDAREQPPIAPLQLVAVRRRRPARRARSARAARCPPARRARAPPRRRTAAGPGDARSPTPSSGRAAPGARARAR